MKSGGDFAAPLIESRTKGLLWATLGAWQCGTFTFFAVFKSKSWTCSSKTELPVPFNSGLKPGTGLVKDDPLARMMKMTKSFEERKKERIYLFGDFWNPHKNLFSLTQLTFTSSSSDSRTTNYFPRNQGITGESWALKDWCKCFTQSSKEGNDLWEVPKGAVGN